ncbi:unnamed protein product, partial [Rotaria sp. Silwood2]
MEENIRKVKYLNVCNDGDVNNNGDYLFSSIMTELAFDVVSSTGQTYELIRGGFHIPINTANFEDYCMHYRCYNVYDALAFQCRYNRYQKQLLLIHEL